MIAPIIDDFDGGQIVAGFMMNDILRTAQLQSVDAVQFDMALARLSCHLPGKQECMKNRRLSSAVRAR